MKKSVFSAMLFQLLVFFVFVVIDFTLWLNGIYCYVAPAIIPSSILIVGVIFCPKKREWLILIFTLILLLPACTIPKLESICDIKRTNSDYEITDLLFDKNFESMLSSEKESYYETIPDRISGEALGLLFMDKTNSKSPHKLYKDRRYAYFLMPVFYLFLFLLIAVFLLVNKKQRKKSNDSYCKS